MDRTKMNYIVDIGLIVSFLAVFITGLIKFPGLLGSLGISRTSVPWYHISRVHDWSGLVMGILVLAHLSLNWAWIVAMTKRYVLKRK